MKKILIINGHPDKESLCSQLAQGYMDGAMESGAECSLYNISDLNFSPNLSLGYRKRTELEPDLVTIQSEISNADHLVIVYPIWWATFPALLKGLIDRVFLPGFAFKYRENSLLWDKLLVGKSARLIVTMDSPRWYYSLFLKNAGIRALKTGVLEFCGVKPVNITKFGSVKQSNEFIIKAWIHKAEKLGRKLK